MQELEQKKFLERLDWAIDVLKNRFPGINPNSEAFMHEASEIARTLFVRSEIAYTGRKA